MHPDEIGNRTAEAFNNFRVLYKGNIFNEMLEFVIFVNPPIKNLFDRTWSTPTVTTDPTSLSRVAMMLGPNKETVFKIWHIKRRSFKGRVKAFFAKPVIAAAFIMWFVSDMLGNS